MIHHQLPLLVRDRNLLESLDWLFLQDSNALLKSKPGVYSGAADRQTKRRYGFLPAISLGKK
jgi:hypothetical protein